MKSEDFSIPEFNRTLQTGVAGQKLDFCQAIALSQRKMSVTLRYSPDIHHSEYAVLDRDLSVRTETDFSSYYYGCSPRIDSDLIIGAISQMALCCEEGLLDFLAEHSTDFMLHKDQGVYLPDVAKLIVVTLSQKYGISFQINKETDFLVRAQRDFPEMIKVRRKDGRIDLHGCPSEELIALLEPYRFQKNGELWTLHENGCSLKEIYGNRANIKLLTGRVFYSGVLIKPLEIRDVQSNYESDNIPNIVICYERSTFAAVCAFDENLIRHPLLAKSRAALTEVFSLDEGYKRELFRGLAGDPQDCRDINAYLKASFNVNQIGVSSNVKSADGKVFFGLRDAGNIDGGSLYPGVNGNAEVYDENVAFYNRSVYEDLPTIRIQDTRCDLLGEITREAYGELRLISKRESWECYGIVISGTAPGEADSGKPRRCHLNILFENEADETFDQIQERRLKASEAFENKHFIAVNIHYYKSRLHFLVMGLLRFFKRLLNSKDFIESFLLLIISATSIHALSFSFDSLSSVLSVVFAALILVFNIIQLGRSLLKALRDVKINRTVRIYENMSYDALNEAVSKAMGKSFHPVAYASLKMHVENLVRTQLSKK